MKIEQEGRTVFPVIVSNSSSLKSVNFYLLKERETLYLIDAGMNDEACWNVLLHTLEVNDLSLSDLTGIILTHHHIDHVGLVDRIVLHNQIPVFVHEEAVLRLKRDSVFLEKRADFFEKLYKEMGCGEAGEKQARFVREAIEKNKDNALKTCLTPIEEGFLTSLSLRIIKMPGHAPDQIALYDEKRGWLFGGDLLIGHISSNAIVEPDSSGNRIMTLVQHRESLEKCLKFNMNIVFPGHGMLIENGKSLIQNRLRRIDKKAEKFVSAIGKGFATAAEIAESYYKNVYYDHFSLVMSEVIGHLDYLENQGRVSKTKVEGVWQYTIQL
ncbi:MBL fold metallo-hydrolase [Domibacillus mangrovi]|uniref:MBL fold metallo-hydrolase n=2 Tax=Domibacillus mangrovi TaxID=1714354 RepID=A0A1Q5P0G1_9BACI|nr:MBL fold metallo-hydrolase [Domibacillus mangrovi]